MSVKPAVIVKGVNGPSSNEEYHANRTHFSSSQIKTLYWDHEKFAKEVIRGEKPEMKQSDALTEGTILHLMCLEPHLFDEQVLVAPLFDKRGNAWKNFVAENEGSGKLIISGAQDLKLKNMYAAFKKRPEAVELVKRSKTEVTIGSEIMGVPVKIRADAIDIDNGIVSDVKSTRFESNIDVFRENAYSQMLSYDISAALYSLVAENELGKPFEFYYIVVSKTDFQCEIYKASPKSIAEGRQKIFSALAKLNTFKETGKWPEARNMLSKPLSGTYEILDL